jgi:hypothetical protein
MPTQLSIAVTVVARPRARLNRAHKLARAFLAVLCLALLAVMALS